MPSQQHISGKTYLRLALLVGSLFCMLSLSTYAQTTDSDLRTKAELETANKALVRRWLSELWHAGDYTVAAELLAGDFKRHSAGHPAAGPEAYAAIVKSCHDGFPDTDISMVGELLADGDRVFVRWRWTGTHTGEFRGVAPTGRPIDVLGEDVIRIQNGQITDIWPLFDPLRLMLQIGAIEKTAP